MAGEKVQKLVKRAAKVAFMGIDTKYHRMKGFTAFSESKNPKEYTRQYIDEEHETTDIVGMSPSIDYGFDRHTNNPVHDHLVKLSDNEVIGTDAVVPILVVDFSGEPADDGSFPAKMRKYSNIPNTEGSSFDAYTHDGTLRSNSEVVFGRATSTDDFESTAEFIEDKAETEVPTP